MIQSELIKFISRLSEAVGLNPNVMIFLFLVLLVLFISAGFILLKLRSTDRELVTVERELEAFGQNSGRLSFVANFSQNDSNKRKPDPNLDRLADNAKQGDVTQKSGMASIALEGPERDGLGKVKDYPTAKNTRSNADMKSGEFASSLISNSGLKKKILDLISKTDKSISLQHLVKHLSHKYFDGNYHPIVNELDRLEREGEIEGQVITGKVFYKKKQKSTRQYILRKGKNFRKYIG